MVFASLPAFGWQYFEFFPLKSSLYLEAPSVGRSSPAVILSTQSGITQSACKTGLLPQLVCSENVITAVARDFALLVI